MIKKLCVIAAASMVLAACQHYNPTAKEAVGDVGQAAAAIPNAVVDATIVQGTDHMMNRWHFAEDVNLNKYPNRLPGTRF